MLVAHCGGWRTVRIILGCVAAACHDTPPCAQFCLPAGSIQSANVVSDAPRRPGGRPLHHLCWADCLAELAGNAALLACWVAAQHVLATEAGADGALLKGVVDLRCWGWAGFGVLCESGVWVLTTLKQGVCWLSHPLCLL